MTSPPHTTYDKNNVVAVGSAEIDIELVNFQLRRENTRLARELDEIKTENAKLKKLLESMIFIKPPEKINENNIYFLFFYNYMYICWGVGYNNNYMYNLKLIILGTLSSLKTTFRGGSHL